MTRKNVVLITVDALRADHTGYLTDDIKLISSIDAVAEDGVSCSRAYANGIPTYFSFRSIFGGRRDIVSDRPIGLPENWTTLADVFDELGYATAGFNAANPWLTPKYNYDSGFQTFVDFLERGSDDDQISPLVTTMRSVQHWLPNDGRLQQKLGFAARMYCSVTENYPTESGEAVTNRALEWMHGRDDNEPFFLWIHYMDPHYPWTPSSENVSSLEIANTWNEVTSAYDDPGVQVDSKTLNRVQKLYEWEVNSVDESIGRVVETIDDEETIVCVTADHGTELDDHGGFSHGPDSLYEEIVHIPLVISGPGVPKQDVSYPVQHIDIPRTLVDLAVDTPPSSLQLEWAGCNFLEDHRDKAMAEVVYDYEPAVSEVDDTESLLTIIDWPWKLHWNRELNTTELYNLKTDPDEMEDRSSSDTGTVNRLKDACRNELAVVESEHRTAAEIVRIRDHLEGIRQEL